jgi:hypothetical protein
MKYLPTQILFNTWTANGAKLHQQHFHATHTLEVYSSSHTTINLLFGRTRRLGRRFWIGFAVTVLTLDEGVGLAVNDRLWILGVFFFSFLDGFSDSCCMFDPKASSGWASFVLGRVSLLQIWA